MMRSILHSTAGTKDVLPFIKYILRTILAAYRDFEDRFSLIGKAFGTRNGTGASLQKIGRFTRQDIRELCPPLSVSSVEGTLRKMAAEGEIKRDFPKIHLRENAHSGTEGGHDSVALKKRTKKEGGIYNVQF